MQAGAMGLPSIVSDINGCNEIIVEGKNGVIIPVKNEKALEQAMQRFIDDKNRFHNLKNNARPMVVERYQQQIIWDALLGEYQGLLN